MPETTPGTLEFGRELFTTWVVPFEIASLVLLVALIGAVWWSGGDEE
jgi:NADH:ubiquinone oxidoreductase subunit 6 (subunit J)